MEGKKNAYNKKGWDIHGRQRSYDRALEALTASWISEENKQLILRFVRHKKVAENWRRPITGRPTGRTIKEASTSTKRDSPSSLLLNAH